MSLIEIRGLRKSYWIYQKKPGLVASLRGLFKRDYEEVEAVRGIDAEREKRQIRRVPGTQWRQQNDYSRAALGCDQSYFWSSHGNRTRSLETRELISQAVRIGDGTKKSARVGSAGKDVISASSADL